MGDQKETVSPGGGRLFRRVEDGAGRKVGNKVGKRKLHAVGFSRRLQREVTPSLGSYAGPTLADPASSQKAPWEKLYCD